MGKTILFIAGLIAGLILIPNLWADTTTTFNPFTNQLDYIIDIDSDVEISSDLSVTDTIFFDNAKGYSGTGFNFDPDNDNTNELVVTTSGDLVTTGDLGSSASYADEIWADRHFNLNDTEVNFGTSAGNADSPDVNLYSQNSGESIVWNGTSSDPTLAISADTTMASDLTVTGSSFFTEPLYLTSTDIYTQGPIDPATAEEWLHLRPLNADGLNLAVHGTGTGADAGYFVGYDEDDSHFTAFSNWGNHGFITSYNASTLVEEGNMRFNVGAGGDVTFFDNSAEGVTKEHKVYGYRTGDAKRSLEIGVGVDAADQASFDGVSDYYFDGSVSISSDLTVSGTGIFMPNMKVGTTQANASAVANELWADSDDGYTIKLGQ